MANRKLRVMWVVEATEGGVRRHLCSLAAHWPYSRMSLMVVAACRRDPDFVQDLEEMVRRGADVFSLPMKRKISPFSDFIAWIRLIRLLRAEQPDLLHAHSAKAGALARFAGWVCHIPVIYTPHAFPFLLRWGWLYRGVERFLVQKTAVLVALSEHERMQALQLGYRPEQVALIPNGCDPCLCSSEPPLDASFRVLFAGRLCEQKGADLLPLIWPSIRAGVPSASLEIYGDGPFLRPLHDVLDQDPRVRFFPPYRQKDVFQILRGAKAVLMPSRWEGCPYLLLEAWAASVPVIASPEAGGIVCDGQDGLLAPLSDPQSWARALARLCEDRNFADRLTENAHLRLHRDFSVQKTTCSLYHLYEEEGRRRKQRGNE